MTDGDIFSMIRVQYFKSYAMRLLGLDFSPCTSATFDIRSNFIPIWSVLDVNSIFFDDLKGFT